MNKNTVLMMAILILALAGVNEFLLKNNLTPHEKKISQSVAVDRASDKIQAAGGEVQASGEALIGGEFSLTDQSGNKFTQENLKGKYSLVYFGFTHCPDACPTALSNMTLAMKELGVDANKFQIVFITTDPERDDVKAMKEYVTNFGPQVVGLTGTKEELKKAEEVYRVYAEKMEKDAKGNYEISHSSIIYIMGKDGKFLSNLTGETKTADIVTKLKTLN